MTAKSVLLHLQGLRPRARAPLAGLTGDSLTRATTGKHTMVRQK